VILALTLMGCGGSSTTLGGTAPTDDGGSPPIDAGRDGASGDDGPGGGPPEGGMGGMESGAATPYFGKIQFLRDDQGTVAAYQAQCEILPTGSMVSALVCPPGAVTSGACCFIMNDPDAGLSSFDSLSAGTLSLANGGVAFATLTYDAQQMQYAVFHDSGMTTWNAGDALQVSASGGTVQAFSGSVAMPAELAGLSVKPNTSPTVNLSTDFAVTWTPGQGASKVTLRLYAGNATEVKCVVDDTSGAVTVPAALLGRLSPNGPGGLFVDSASVATAKSPNATSELAAFNEVFVNVGFQP
jgi:hypothetical protein